MLVTTTTDYLVCIKSSIYTSTSAVVNEGFEGLVIRIKNLTTIKKQLSHEEETQNKNTMAKTYWLSNTFVDNGLSVLAEEETTRMIQKLKNLNHHQFLLLVLKMYSLHDLLNELVDDKALFSIKSLTSNQFKIQPKENILFTKTCRY